MKMVSLKPHVYAGRRLVVGQEFEVRGQSDANLLNAIGRAEKAPVVVAVVSPPVPPVALAHRTRVVEAEVAPEVRAESATEPAAVERPKRVYRRRDLTAEG